MGRDLSRIRLSLIDFFSQSNKGAYLDKHEVPHNRIEEIKAKLTGFSLTRHQFFWPSVLNIKAIPNAISYIKNGAVDMQSISTELNVSSEVLSSTSAVINYDLIHSISNIEPLAFLFDLLDIELTEFIKKSDIQIDFRHYYTKQLEGIKQKAKPLFESKLHEFLSTKDILEKSKFQDRIDVYSNEPIKLFDNYILSIDIIELFISAFNKKYPFLILWPSELNLKMKIKYLIQFKKYEKEFKGLISNRINYENVLEVFFCN